MACSSRPSTSYLVAQKGVDGRDEHGHDDSRLRSPSAIQREKTISFSKEDDVLELYHNINSVCAQKVRIALSEKGQDVEEHILTLRGDQNDPAYMKLNPNGV